MGDVFGLVRLGLLAEAGDARANALRHLGLRSLARPVRLDLPRIRLTPILDE